MRAAGDTGVKPLEDGVAWPRAEERGGLQKAAASVEGNRLWASDTCAVTRLICCGLGKGRGHGVQTAASPGVWGGVHIKGVPISTACCVHIHALWVPFWLLFSFWGSSCQEEGALNKQPRC